MTLNFEPPYVRTSTGKLHVNYCGVAQRSNVVEKVSLAEMLTMLNDGYRYVPQCCGASPCTWVSVRFPKLFPWGWWLMSDALPEIEVDLDAMRADVVAELTELEKYEQACRAMYAEMRRWHDEGYTVLLMERDGENLKLRPVY